jgi:signal transduction histidine kinase
VSPQFEPGQRILPRLQGPARFLPAEARDTAWFRAGTQVKPLLDRAKRVTLSGVRVLDPRGVVVASSGGELGAVLDDLPEVQGAMRGQYTVVGRERISDEPAPPLDGIRRRGRVRLFTALPVFRDGALVAVVRASRTGVDVIEALWLYRGEMSLALLACIGLTMSVAWALSRAISRPVRDLMDAARAITRGEARRPFRARGFVPAELFALSESLDALTAQLTERADYVAAFAAQAGHELKTPLTSIRGAVELLSDAGDEMPTAERARFLRNLTADTDRMERLVLRLLTLARLENPTAPPPEEDIPIRAWFEAVAARHGEGVRLHLASDLPPRLRIAPEHLEGAVLNLVDNALRHGAGAPIDLGGGAAPRRGGARRRGPRPRAGAHRAGPRTPLRAFLHDGARPGRYGPRPRHRRRRRSGAGRPHRSRVAGRRHAVHRHALRRRPVLPGPRPGGRRVSSAQDLHDLCATSPRRRRQRFTAV